MSKCFALDCVVSALVDLTSPMSIVSVAFLLAAFVPPVAYGQLVTWNGSAGQNWSSANSWTASNSPYHRVPTSSDGVLISTKGTTNGWPVILGGYNAVADSVDIYYSGGGNSPATLSINASTLTAGYGVSVGNGSAAGAGNLFIEDATLNANSLYVGGGGYVDVFPGSHVQHGSGSISLNVAASSVNAKFDMNGTALVAGTITLSTSGSGDALFDWMSGSVIMSTLNLNSGGVFTWEGTGGTTNASLGGTVKFNGGDISVISGDTLSLSNPIQGTAGINKLDAGTLVLAGANTYSGNTTVSAGTLEYNITSGAVSVTNGATVTISSGAAVVAGGTVDPFSDSSGNHVNIVNNSTVTGGGFSVTAGSKSIGTLTGAGETVVDSGTPSGTAMLEMASFVQNSLSLKNAGALTLRDRTTGMPIINTVASLDIDTSNGARLNLGDNALVVGYGSGGTDPASTIRDDLQSAFHVGAWDGPGLGTTPVGGTGLGYADLANSEDVRDTSGDWIGQPVDINSVVAVLTWYGDCNLDGVVNSTDYAMMGVSPADDWFHGDLNYDGVVNGDDWSLFMLGDLEQSGDYPTYAAGPGAIPDPNELLAQYEAEFARESIGQIKAQVEAVMRQPSITPLPEPSACLVLAGLGILAVRRQRAR